MSAPESGVRPDVNPIAEADSASNELADRKRAQALLSAQRRSLQLIASGANLTDVLQDLCDTIDSQDLEIISSILLMDSNGEYLLPAAGRRVSEQWAQILTPVPIGPQNGSCGTAAFLKQPVITSDIASDPLWRIIEGIDFKNLALSHGLRAAWSYPLVSKDDEVLGTFAIYYPQPKKPTDSDLELIEGAANIAVIAIEGDRSRAALEKAFEDIKKSEAKLRQEEMELRQITDAIAQSIMVLAPDGTALYANQSTLNFSGLTMDAVMAADFRTRFFHPEDVERLREERQLALTKGIPFENEQRALRNDGEYRWFLVQYMPVKDEDGQILRWYATGTDIHDRKQAEERVQSENLALREEIDRTSMFEEIVGSSEVLHNVLRQVAKVAPMDSTVLILGETGTGKELIARAIHKKSNRAARAFIRVNCAAIPPSLLASELFGHEKGAFTGATHRRMGRFEAADRGTIFLDEIGDLPPETQVALLRVLQEREFERVGNSRPISVDVRVLAATNRDLRAAVAEGTFREDLFYRLNVFPIEVPSLRERVDDIPLLVDYLIERYAKKVGKRIKSVSKKSLDLFQAYDWPGNIRELQNVIERAVILSDGETFSVDHTWLKPQVFRESRSVIKSSRGLVRHPEREKELIESALAETKGRISGPLGAATRLGIPRQTLESKIRSLGIDKHRFRQR